MCNFSEKSSFFRIFAGAITALMLCIFLVAKIPSSKCHCRDPIKSKKEACPFGALRNLTITSTESTLKLELPRVLLKALSCYSHLALQSFSAPVVENARDPPS